MEHCVVFDWLSFPHWLERQELGQTLGKKKVCFIYPGMRGATVTSNVERDHCAFQKEGLSSHILQHPPLPQKCTWQPSGSADAAAIWVQTRCLVFPLKEPRCCCIITIKAQTISEVVASIQAYLSEYLWMNGVTSHPAAAYMNDVLYLTWYIYMLLPKILQHANKKKNKEIDWRTCSEIAISAGWLSVLVAAGQRGRTWRRGNNHFLFSILSLLF